MFWLISNQIIKLHTFLYLVNTHATVYKLSYTTIINQIHSQYKYLSWNGEYTNFCHIINFTHTVLTTISTFKSIISVLYFKKSLLNKNLKYMHFIHASSISNFLLKEWQCPFPVLKFINIKKIIIISQQTVQSSL